MALPEPRRTKCRKCGGWIVWCLTRRNRRFIPAESIWFKPFEMDAETGVPFFDDQAHEKHFSYCKVEAAPAPAPAPKVELVPRRRVVNVTPEQAAAAQAAYRAASKAPTASTPRQRPLLRLVK